MKALLLLSGGIDSPVAAKMMLDQGVELEALHCSFEPVTDDASVIKVKQLAKILGIQTVHVAKLGEALGKIPTDRDAHKFYFVLQKRMFYRLADMVADQTGCDVIVTGENLGQVSSQTLENLATLESASKRPILRPLLGLDKMEIVEHAKRMGTYETSLGPELCDLLGPDKPATRSDLDKIEAFEEKLGLIAALPPIEAQSLA